MNNKKAVIYRTKKDSDERIAKIGEKEFVTPDKITSSRLITVFPELEYQTVLGFGGAFTEAASTTYDCLDKDEKEKVIKAYFDKEEGICTFYLTFFVNENGLYRRFDEQHTERVYTDEKIRKTAKKNGFEIVGTFGGNYDFKSPNFDEERIFYVAKKIKNVKMEK